MTNFPVFDTSADAMPWSSANKPLTAFGFSSVFVESVFTRSPCDMALAPFIAFIAFMAAIAIAESVRTSASQAQAW